MISAAIEITVRFDEVDMMGFVYHGNYAKYYHISRTHLLRKIGISDKTLASNNIIMPLIDISIKYLKPVFYDEKILVKTSITEQLGVKLKFNHTVCNKRKEIINTASSTMVFVDAKTNKAIRIPEVLIDKIQQCKK